MTAHTVGRLTVKEIENAKPPEGKKARYLNDGGGLLAKIGPGAARSWVFRYRVDGKLHEMGLGALKTWSLAEARERALAQRKLRGADVPVDPIEHRKAARAAARLDAAKTMTFKQCADAYVAAHKT